MKYQSIIYSRSLLIHTFPSKLLSYDHTSFIIKNFQLQYEHHIESHPEYFPFSFHRLIRTAHRIDVYIFDSARHSWELFSINDGQGCILKLKKMGQQWYIEITQADSNLLRMYRLVQSSAP